MTETEQPDRSEEHDRPANKVELEAISSKELFKGRSQVLIEHEGEIYRLQVTRNGGLILQK